MPSNPAMKQTQGLEGKLRGDSGDMRLISSEARPMMSP